MGQCPHQQLYRNFKHKVCQRVHGPAWHAGTSIGQHVTLATSGAVASRAQKSTVECLYLGCSPQRHLYPHQQPLGSRPRHRRVHGYASHATTSIGPRVTAATDGLVANHAQRSMAALRGSDTPWVLKPFTTSASQQVPLQPLGNAVTILVRWQRASTHRGQTWKHANLQVQLYACSSVHALACPCTPEVYP